MDWLEWVRKLNRSRLEGIVALLLALAALADRAAGLTGPRRHSALRVLGYAEAEARAFVITMAQDTGTPGVPAAVAALAHGQAENLAASFRALALLLITMLALARRFARPDKSGPQAGAPMPPRRCSAPQGRRRVAVAAFDTS